jgi:hypothetical protein
MLEEGKFENKSKRMPRKIIVKTLTTTKSVDEVFDFFANMKNMELGGAIQSMEEIDDGWWIFDHSVLGKSRMKHTLSREFGIIDHVFIGGGLEWNVFVRVVPNQSGSTTCWTFMRQNSLSEGNLRTNSKCLTSKLTTGEQHWRIFEVYDG